MYLATAVPVVVRGAVGDPVSCRRPKCVYVHFDSTTVQFSSTYRISGDGKTRNAPPATVEWNVLKLKYSLTQ